MQEYNQCLQSYKETHPGSDYGYVPSFLSGCGYRPFRAGYDVIGDTIFGNKYPARYLEDSYYRELTHIKENSSFQLFIEKFGIGWWGIIAIVIVFLLNFFVALVKLFAKYAPILIRTGGLQIKLAKTNIGNMPIFQRYLLLLVLLILIMLMIKL